MGWEGLSRHNDDEEGEVRWMLREGKEKEQKEQERKTPSLVLSRE